MEVSWILSGGMFALEKADWSAIKRRKFHRTLNLGVGHVHARQLRAVLERLDVACGVAVASINGERSMRQRPRGREVEKRVGSALSVTPKNGKFHRKRGLWSANREISYLAVGLQANLGQSS